MASVYETDFYSWAKEQAELARNRSANALDWDNVAEELEGLSRSEYRELRSRLIVLLAHLLKWTAQPDKRSNSWTATIREQRRAIARHLADNPGLTVRVQEAFDQAYPSARDYAIAQTNLDESTFPQAAPFTLEQAQDANWLP
jgi:ribosomal protein L29